MPSRPSDSRAASHRPDDGRSELRGRQDVAPQRDDRHRDRAELRGNRMAHQKASLSSARAEARHEHRPTVGDRGGRPSAAQIQLNKRIAAARNAEGILAIVEAEHEAFNAVNASTACNRLAKTHQGSSYTPTMDDRRVKTLFSTINRVSADLKAQAVANTLWALATLGWQAAEGAMRAALEGAAVRVAPSMNAQGVADTLWALGDAEACSREASCSDASRPHQG